MKIILTSFFNSNNLGDLLLSNKLFIDLKSHGHLVERCSIEKSFKINGYLKIYRYSSLKYLVFLPYRIMKSILFFFRFAYKLYCSDLLIIGGGNVMMDYSLRSLSYKKISYYINIAKFMRKKVYAISIGIGPFKISNQLIKARETLSKVDYVTFRDEFSRNLYNPNKIYNNDDLSIDPILIIDEKENLERVKPKEKIALGIINPKLFNSTLEDYNKIINGYLTLISKLVDTEKSVVLFSTEELDYKTILEVYDKLNKQILNKVQIMFIRNVLDLENFYKSDIHLIISSRMHSLILAYRQKIPMIGLSWHPKIEQLFKILEIEDSFFDILTFNISISKMINRINSPNQLNYKKLNMKFKKMYEKNFKFL